MMDHLQHGTDRIQGEFPPYASLVDRAVASNFYPPIAVLSPLRETATVTTVASEQYPEGGLTIMRVLG